MSSYHARLSFPDVVLYSVFIIQRRTDLWGEDALEFRPERWLEPELIKRLSENPSMFMPFHAGPRLVRHPTYFETS